MSFLPCSLHSYLSKKDTVKIVQHETEQLWQMSQFTDFSLSKPTKCLILKSICRQVHIYTQMLNFILTATCGDVHHFWHSQPVFPWQLCPSPSATGRRFLRWLSRALLNEKIVFSTFKTHKTHMYGGRSVYIFRSLCTDVTNGQWIASYVVWYPSFREGLWSLSQICSSALQDERKKEKERNTFLT